MTLGHAVRGHRSAFLLPVDSSIVSQQSMTHSLLSMLEDKQQERHNGLDLQKNSCRCTPVPFSSRCFHLTKSLAFFGATYCSTGFGHYFAGWNPLFCLNEMHTFNCNLETLKSYDGLLIWIEAWLSPGNLLKPIRLMSLWYNISSTFWCWYTEVILCRILNIKKCTCHVCKHLMI